MQTVVIEAFGGADQLKDKTLPIPPVKENEVRIKLKACSFNPVDFKIRKGLFGGDFPMILGHDGAGIIDEIGPGVTNFKVGDEVYAFIFGTPKSNGAYAEFVSIAQQYVALKPKSLSFEEAAGVPLVGLTALEIIKKAKPVKGQGVFVAGASGGVGSVVVHLLRDVGAFPIVTTAGSNESEDYINKHLGIPREHIVRYDRTPSSDLAAAVRSRFPNKAGASISIDLFGSSMKSLAFAVLDTDGHVITIVEEPAEYVTPLYPSIAKENSLFSANATFTMVFVGARAFSKSDPRDWAVYNEGLVELTKLIDDGNIQAPKITNVGNLKANDVAKAHHQLEDGHTKGKMVISIP